MASQRVSTSKGIVGAGAVEEGQRVDEVQGEGLVQRKVGLEIEVDPEFAAGGLPRDPLDDAPLDERLKQLPGAALQGALARLGLVAVLDQAAHDPASVGVAAERLEEDPVRDDEARLELLRGRRPQPLEGPDIPAHASLRGPLLDKLLLAPAPVPPFPRPACWR